MSEVIKCPFCDSPDFRYRYHQWVEVRPYYVQCKNCLATGGSGNSKEEALAKWAQRAEAPQKDGCPCCGVGTYVEAGAGDDEGEYFGCYDCFVFGSKKPTSQEAWEAWCNATREVKKTAAVVSKEPVS